MPTSTVSCAATATATATDGYNTISASGSDSDSVSIRVRENLPTYPSGDAYCSAVYASTYRAQLDAWEQAVRDAWLTGDTATITPGLGAGTFHQTWAQSGYQDQVDVVKVTGACTWTRSGYERYNAKGQYLGRMQVVIYTSPTTSWYLYY